MTTDVTIPASGESVTSANVAVWHRAHGDTVRAGEVLVTIETDKVSNELEAPQGGVLEIVVQEGEEVPIGTVIARIQGSGEGSPPVAAPVAAPKPVVPASPPVEPVLAPAPAPVVPASAPVVSAPVVATSAPVVEPVTQPVLPPAPAPAPASDPGLVPVTRPDFSLTPVREAGAASAPVTDGRTTRRKMSMLRRKIATQLVNAQQTAAILTTFNEVDMSGVMKLRKEVQDEFVRKHGVKLGFMSFFVKAVVQALKDVPALNGRIEGNEVVQNHYYDIGVAIGTDKGLFVPVIRDADQKSFAAIEKDIADYANKAKEGGITIEDLQGGVFSISNGGTYGSLLSTPILNPPQSGILGMHTIQQRPVAVDGQVVIRPMMYLALSYDHRLVDGREAVGFLIRIKECMESPTRLLLEM